MDDPPESCTALLELCTQSPGLPLLPHLLELSAWEPRAGVEVQLRSSAPDKEPIRSDCVTPFLVFVSEKQQPTIRGGGTSYVSGASDEVAPDYIITWK